MRFKWVQMRYLIFYYLHWGYSWVQNSPVGDMSFINIQAWHHMERKDSRCNTLLAEISDSVSLGSSKEISFQSQRRTSLWFSNSTSWHLPPKHKMSIRKNLCMVMFTAEFSAITRTQEKEIIQKSNYRWTDEGVASQIHHTHCGRENHASATTWMESEGIKTSRVSQMETNGVFSNSPVEYIESKLDQRKNWAMQTHGIGILYFNIF